MTANAENLGAKTNIIQLITPNTENLKSRNAINIKALEKHKTGLVGINVDQFRFF